MANSATCHMMDSVIQGQSTVYGSMKGQQKHHTDHGHGARLIGGIEMDLATSQKQKANNTSHKERAKERDTHKYTHILYTWTESSWK